MSAAAPQPRRITRVAVGVLARGDGRVLLADRPTGKAYAGYWEFPGGKIEPGEDVAAALARELHEELGIDIGPSVPWVTFEFDYPHAYVELQFRIVRDWRGEPHAREGQRLCFADPAAELPQPLLPAAVPALRWLQLPRAVIVVGPLGLPGSTATSDGAQGIAPGTAARIVVVDADWRPAGMKARLPRLRAEPGIRNCLLLASGQGAPTIDDADGVVLAANEIAEVPDRSRGLRGGWVDCRAGLELAVKGGCDFVLVRSAELAGQLRARSAPLPAYFPAERDSTGMVDSNRLPGQGLWFDLRSPVEPADREPAPR